MNRYASLKISHFSIANFGEFRPINVGNDEAPPINIVVDTTPKALFPRILSPSERNKEANRPQLHLKGYSRKRMVMRRNILGE